MRWIISLLLALWAAPAGACALALAFALDISVSVDRAEYGLQRDGLAAALLDPEVSQALLAQPGGVALMAYEWSGRASNRSLSPGAPSPQRAIWRPLPRRFGARAGAHRNIPPPSAALSALA